MIAENNEYMKEASKTIFQLSADELIQKRCRDREEYYDDIRSYQHALEKRDATIEEQSNTISNLRQKLIDAGINPDEYSYHAKPQYKYINSLL